MCGIIGYFNKNTTESDIEILKKVMIESRIRGKHASGIAWCSEDNTILSIKQPIPIDKLVEKFDFSQLFHNGSEVSMIAHARYSTSDIQYNQPIVGKTKAIAHNGVITQSPPETWEETYGYKCKTKNDSELLLKACENGDSIKEKFPNSSMAYVILDSAGNISGNRNGLRPLWMGVIGKGCVIASTYDILRRAGVTEIEELAPAFNTKDLQKRNMKLREEL